MCEGAVAGGLSCQMELNSKLDGLFVEVSKLD